MDSDVAVFVAAAAGVAGAAIGAWATAYAARLQMQEAARQERERRTDDAETAAKARQLELAKEEEWARSKAQVAARILQADTVRARTRLRSAQSGGRYWSRPFAPPTAAWLAYRSEVARYMDLAGWASVERWFSKLQTLEAYAVAEWEKKPSVRQPPIGAQALPQVARALELSVAALAALEAFTRDATQYDSDAEPDEEDT